MLAVFCVRTLCTVKNKRITDKVGYLSHFLFSLHRLVQEKRMGYMETLMGPLVEAAKDDVGELK